MKTLGFLIAIFSLLFAFHKIDSEITNLKDKVEELEQKINDLDNKD